MAKKGDVRIVRQADGPRWNVKQSADVQSSHRTQAAAIDKGTSIAKRDRVDVVVHGRDGKIRSKGSYGNETSRRDTEH